MMVGLRKFFNADKGAPPPPATIRQGDVSSGDLSQLNRIDNHPYAPPSGGLSPMSPSFSPELKSPRLLDMDHHFVGIERQFEALHEHFHSRPMSTFSQSRSDTPSSSTTRTGRHVDLLEALFSSHRYHISSRSLSPTSLYNEDVADRNMSRMRETKPKGSRYSRILSAIYQEDVADRNIASRGSDVSFTGSRRSGQSSQVEPRTSTTSQLSSDAWDRESNKLTVPGRQNGRILVTSSQDNLRRVPHSVDEDPVSYSQGARTSPTQSLRAQKSAPNLSIEQVGASQSIPSSGSANHLDVPRGYAYGGKLSNVPLPDSPTLPELRCYNQTTTYNRRVDHITSPVESNPQAKSKSTGSSDAARAASKKNVRDLSINTELASGRRPPKIEHRAIQPPTPRQYLGPQSPSIAEIVNSPLPAATPTSVSSLPTPSYNVEEIMNMFKQAYVTTQATSPHPTFETLQDAIVREINSHEAFRQVPVPDTGPAFTPSPTQDGFSGDFYPQTPAVSDRSLSEKESQFTKLIRKGSLGRKRRSKSISSTNHLKSYDKLFKRSESGGRRRRHTYAQPPSAGLIDAMYPDRQTDGGNYKESITYRDVFPNASEPQPFLGSSSNVKSESDLRNARNRNPTASTDSGDLRDMLQSRHTVVRRLRAHTSVSAREDRTFFMEDDDPDDIIQLPHVEPRPTQIKSVDDNDVTYFLNATAPIDPRELIKKSRIISNKNPADGNAAAQKQRNASFALSKRRIPLRRSSLNKDTADTGRMAW